MKGPDEIAVRAYTERPRASASAQGRGRRRQGNDQPSRWALVFDCETTTDAAQRLRFGAYQVRKGEDLHEVGLFFDPGALSADEVALVRAHAETNALACRDMRDFVERVFYRYGYDRRGAIIGFNLPFDVSRLAIGHSPARQSMRGGFTFKLSRFKSSAAVRVKHLSRRASLFDFAAAGRQETTEASRKRGVRTPTKRGFFIDVSTLASALYSEGFTLARLCERLKVETPKGDPIEHGTTLTDHYIAYARTDVQATWECYVALRDQYAKHRLDRPLHRILSEASIGKAYLEQMGIAPLLQCQPDFPRCLFGKIMSAYYGGRAEVHWRRTIKRVLYCDFKSMYPTVNALMGLWSFVIGDGLRWRDGTVEARNLLDAADAETFRAPEAWWALRMIVRVRPDNDLFPVRAKYDGQVHTIGLNHLSYDGDFWMTLADCIAAKILSGKAPFVKEAIAFEPGPPQPGLAPADLFGDPAYRVNPIMDDVFARLVDLRDAAKAKGDPLQQAIKIIANATSYGVFIEIIRDDAPRAEPISVYGPSGDHRQARSKALEQPGRYFNPLLGVLITGAARLMLALAEHRVLDAGLDWAFCDTDSLAIIKPDEISEAAFLERANSVVDWFAPLNPYQQPGSILKFEAANCSLDDDAVVEPLYCLAISAKRYVLFNLDTGGTPIIRKASAHGLGHLRAPYRDADAPAHIPQPSVPLSEIGVERWQHDLWFEIVRAALAGHPDQVYRHFHPNLQAPAASRYGITSPRLGAWMKSWNAQRPYGEQARPFNFMLTFQARPSGAAVEGDDTVARKRGRPKKSPAIHPVAPFDVDAGQAASRVFDRVTGAAIRAGALQSYAEALQQYHLHPEDKFLDADFCDRGVTRRRHVMAHAVRLIGKEANKWEEGVLAVEAQRLADYGAATMKKHK
jgi:hypothetical protein